ncbi:hypothetical protein KAR48_20915 [bacterium]|nr:hypothetical protein [bacterium]
MKYKFTSLLLILLFVIPSFAQVGFNIRMCNNQIDKHWIMSAAPQITLSNNWFALCLDGTIFYYHPESSPESTIFLTRMSIVPMLKLQWKIFYLAAGYGIAHQFRREDLLSNEHQVEITEKNEFKGEARFICGIELHLSGSVSIVVKGGYNYINDKNHYYSASVGLNFHAPHNVSPKISTPLTPQEKIDNIFVPEIRKKAVTNKKVVTNNSKTDTIITSNIKSAVFLKSEDPVINELNTFLEASLKNSSIQIFDWNKIKQTVEDHYKNQQIEDAQRQVHLKTNYELMMLGGTALGIDVMIETQLRYRFKRYGGDILVQFASIRMISSTNGKVLWAGSFKGNNKKLAELKYTIAEELLEQIL